MRIGIVTFNADIFARSRFRQEFTKLKWNYPEFDWQEAKGLLQSDFKCIGPDWLMQKVYDAIKAQESK
jgi:hypothetical protein